MADPFDLDPLLRFLPLLWHPDHLVSAQVGGGERFLGGGKFGERTREDQVTSFLSATWAQVDNMICRAYNRLLVLYDDECIPLVAQSAHDLEEFADITLMKADTRFIHHKERVDQGCPKASCQIYPLDLSAGECLGGTVESEIPQADRLEVAESRNDLIQKHRRPRITWRNRELTEQRRES